MAVLVFKQWIYKPNSKSSPKKTGNMLRYIATRQGVELPTKDEMPQSELYLQYIAERPGAELGDTQTHGLFGKLSKMRGEEDIAELEKTRLYVEQLAHEKKTIYNAVISLKEEDAIRKGYTNRIAWKELICSQINNIAREMELEPMTLEWVASVHMEQGHPHLHLMYWDTAQRVGVNFINPMKSDKIRYDLTKVVFKEELQEIYREKDVAQKELIEAAFGGKNGGEGILKMASRSLGGMTPAQLKELSLRCHATDEVAPILSRRISDSKIEQSAQLLYGLQEVMEADYKKGAYKYEYLPLKLKEAVGKVCEQLIRENKDISTAYQKYMDAALAQAEIYGGEGNVKAELEKQQAELNRQIGNKVLACINPANMVRQTKVRDDSLEGDDIDMSTKKTSGEAELHTDCDVQPEEDGIFVIDGSFIEKANAQWTNSYKQAKKLMLGDEEIPPNFIEAQELLMIEAKKGNAFAMLDIGKMLESGLGQKADIALANKWYKSALTSFHAAYTKKPTAYLEYNIGKMYHDGIGVQRDDKNAVHWLSLAAKSNTAEKGGKLQYSLAKLYLNGEGVQKDVAKGISLMELSAEQQNQFAQYTLGKLLIEGTEVRRNTKEGLRLLLLSAKQGNTFAKYKLGYTYLFGKDVKRNRVEGMKWLDEAAKGGNSNAASLIQSLNSFQRQQVISLLQDILAVIVSSDNANNNRKLFTGHDLTKAEKRELSKKEGQKGNSLGR